MSIRIATRATSVVAGLVVGLSFLLPLTVASAAPPSPVGATTPSGAVDCDAYPAPFTPDPADLGKWQDWERRHNPNWSTCSQLTPALSCVFDNGDGSYTAALGYTNPTGLTVKATPGGYFNYLYGPGIVDPSDGQPTYMWPGTSTTAFTVTWTPRRADDTVYWELGGARYTRFSAQAPQCAAHPVPINGNAIAAASAMLLAVGGLAFANRRRLGAAGLTRAATRRFP